MRCICWADYNEISSVFVLNPIRGYVSGTAVKLRLLASLYLRMRTSRCSPRSASCCSGSEFLKLVGSRWANPNCSAFLVIRWLALCKAIMRQPQPSNTHARQHSSFIAFSHVARLASKSVNSVVVAHFTIGSHFKLFSYNAMAAVVAPRNPVVMSYARLPNKSMNHRLSTKLAESATLHIV